MNFIDITSLGITTELEVLKRDTQRNSFFLYQHKGVFFADNMRIGNNNQGEAELKFINVLSKAKQDNIAMVISPEYSCPKSVVDKVINEQDFRPNQGKIWALGGESLNKEQLIELTKLNSDQLFIYFEDVISNSDKVYVDPLYYIFNGRHEGVDKMIIIIQFKSRHMGGLWSSQLEPNHLIEGNTVYIIKNNDYSVRLMSFICSESMNFDAKFEPELIQKHSWTDSPYLILSLQFNPDPSHSDFIAFKRFVLIQQKRELITLNWGLETTYQDGGRLYKDKNAPRSGIYFRTTDINLDYQPARILENHEKGLYFLQIQRDKRVYFLNRNVELFKVDNKPVDISDGVDPQQRREGPSVSNIYNFDLSLNLKEIDVVTDNHIEFLRGNGIINAYMLDSTKSIVDKERLINISSGKVRGKEKNKWADVIHLNSFILEEDTECNNRLTYIEDNYPSSESVRSNNCSVIFELDQNIIPNTAIYPHSIKHLAESNVSLAFSRDAKKFDYKYNIIKNNGEIAKATLCYVGNHISPEVINKTFGELQKLFDEESPGKNTIVVFYKKGNVILHKSSLSAGSITDIPKDESSIA